MPRMAPLVGDMVVSRVTGIPATYAKLKRINHRVEKACERGVKNAMEFARRETIKVTPKDTGDLRKSIKISIRGKGTETVGILYCDDSVAPYAIYVHEDLTKWHAPGTYAKFMQRAMWEKRKQISDIIRREIDKELKRMR